MDTERKIGTLTTPKAGFVSYSRGTCEAAASFSQDWQETGFLNRRPYSMDKGALTRGTPVVRLINKPSP